MDDNLLWTLYIDIVTAKGTNYVFAGAEKTGVPSSSPTVIEYSPPIQYVFSYRPTFPSYMHHSCQPAKAFTGQCHLIIRGRGLSEMTRAKPARKPRTMNDSNGRQNLVHKYLCNIHDNAPIGTGSRQHPVIQTTGHMILTAHCNIQYPPVFIVTELCQHTVR